MKIPRTPSVWLGLALGLLLVAVPGFAQFQNGTVRGVVLDQTGAVVPNAKVTATNEATNAEVSITTTSAGVYTFPALLVGAYRLRVEASGFKAYVRQNIQVLGAQVTDVTVNMELGSISTVVAVEAGANIVQTESSQVSGTFVGRTISEIPLVNGANLSVLNLAPYLPNTTTPAGGTSGNGGSVGGLRGRENSFTIDGVDNLDPTTTVASQQVIPDAVQELAINQNIYSAEYGRGAGGQFNVITKSGSNNLHFSAWLYNTNRAYDAADNQEVANIVLNQHDPTKGSPNKRRYDFNRAGGEIGAPIIKNKLFIYGAYEFNNIGQQATAPTGLAPTADGMAMISPLIVDAQAKALVAQFPVAPVQTTCGNPPGPCFISVTGVAAPGVPVGSITTVAPTFETKHDYIINGDWNLNKQSLHVRYLKDRDRTPSFGSSFPQAQFASSSAQDNRRVIVNHVWTVSSTLLNDFRGSFARYSQFFPLVGVAQNYPTLFVDDLPNTTIGPNGNLPQHRLYNEYLLGDTITKTKGRHTLKWGGEFYWFTSPSVFLSNERGQYDYAHLSDLVNDLAPRSNNVTLQGIGNAFFAGNSRDFNLFIQDDVKVTPRLTLNLGLRYDFFGNAADMNSNALNSIADLPGSPLVFHNPKSDWNNVGPRIGFAWDPTGSGKWSIRGGGAVSYDVIPWNFYVNALPVERDVVLNPSTACAGSFSAPPAWCTNGGKGFLANGAMKATFIPPNTQAFARAQTANLIPDAVSPKVFSWSLSVQREVMRNTSVEVRYLGTRALELPLQLQLNSITAFQNGATPLPTYIHDSDRPATVPLTAPSLAQFNALIGTGAHRRYGPQGFLGVITDEAPSGNSTYHGGSIDVNHRAGHGLLLRANYTYSKVMDNGTNDVATSFVNPRRPQDPYDLRDEWARSALDATNKISLLYLYDIPKVAWKNKFARGALNGWTWTGGYLFQTGQPVTILSNVASNGNADSAPGRAILNPSGTEGVGSLVTPVCRNAVTGATTVDAGCTAANTVGYEANNPNAKYIQAQAGAVTNLGRDTYNSPHTNSWNMGMSRAITVTERFNLTMRVDATNVFNHPNYTLNQLGYISFTKNALSNYSNLTSTLNNTFLNAPALFTATTRGVQLGLKLTY